MVGVDGMHQGDEDYVYVTRVVIDGVRGFSRARAVDLDLSSTGAGPGWTVLAGRNASGKTTILRAIALALAGPRRSGQLLTELDRWISQGMSAARVEVQIIPDSRYDSSSETTSASARPLWLGVEWTAPRETEGGGSISEAAPELKASPFLRRNTRVSKSHAAAVTWEESSEGFFYAAYGPFRRLTGAGSEAQRLMLAPIPLSRITSLFREDASLAESVRWLQEQYFRQLEGRPGAEELVNGVISLLNDGLMPDDFKIDRVDSDGLWLRRNNSSLPLQQFSDGYRTVSSLVTDLIRNLVATFPDFQINDPKNSPHIIHPGVVLIDEIDVHLHITWQQRIGPWLTSHFPNIQFLVTTHSPYVCQSAREGGLIRLPGISEAGSPKPVDGQLYRRIVHGTGDEAVTSELFGVDSLYQDTTRTLRRALTDLEGTIALGNASRADITEYERLRSELASSPLSRVGELSEDEQ
jgi:hypothetical protein